MKNTKYLIVNADDFGRSPGINRGIIQAHERGIVTTASLMVRWPAAVAAATYGRDHSEFGLGLHLDLAEWVFRDETWVPVYEVVPVSDRLRVDEEIRCQLATFRRLVGRDPTHIDSHQHVHREEPVRSLAVQLAGELRVPLRGFEPTVTYRGSFYGQSATGRRILDLISLDNLIDIIKKTPIGITELGCHPGQFDGDTTMPYNLEREMELRVLCDPKVREIIKGENIIIITYRDLNDMFFGEAGRIYKSPSIGARPGGAG